MPSPSEMSSQQMSHHCPGSRAARHSSKQDRECASPLLESIQIQPHHNTFPPPPRLALFKKEARGRRWHPESNPLLRTTTLKVVQNLLPSITAPTPSSHRKYFFRPRLAAFRNDPTDQIAKAEKLPTKTALPFIPAWANNLSFKLIRPCLSHPNEWAFENNSIKERLCPDIAEACLRHFLLQIGSTILGGYTVMYPPGFGRAR